MVFRRRNQSGSPSQPDPAPAPKLDPLAAASSYGIPFMGTPEFSYKYSFSGHPYLPGSLTSPPAMLPPGVSKASKRPETPHEEQAEPVRALKGARLVLELDGVRFKALTAASTYAPEATSECHCRDRDDYTFTGLSYSYLSAVMAGRELPPGPHKRPTHDSKCGFYAWKHGEPFPFTARTWLLEVDLYGRVIEHEHGYRAQKQRVLRASPVPGLMCEPPYHLVAAHDGGHITAACGSCPDTPSHPVTPERLRALLNVEIDLGWAQSMRDGS